MGGREIQIQKIKHPADVKDPQFEGVGENGTDFTCRVTITVECTTQHLLLVSYYIIIIIIIIHTRININTIIFVIRFKKEKRGNVMQLSDWSGSDHLYSWCLGSSSLT